ncbi:hypothetical protein GCM10029992_58230 [Glycomyces albus]
MLHFGQQVGGDHDGDALIVGEPLEQGPHVVDAGRVQAVGRLVEDQQFGLLEQRLGHREPLPHAQRVALDRLLGLVAQADLLQDLVDPGPRDPGALGQQLEGEAPGEVLEELRRLHDRADAGDHAGQSLGHELAEDPHVAAVGADEAQQRPERSGLAGPVGPQEAVDLARADLHIEAVECVMGLARDPAIGLAQPRNLNYWGHLLNSDLKTGTALQTSLEAAALQNIPGIVARHRTARPRGRRQSWPVVSLEPWHSQSEYSTYQASPWCAAATGFSTRSTGRSTRISAG